MNSKQPQKDDKFARDSRPEPELLSALSDTSADPEARESALFELACRVAEQQQTSRISGLISSAQAMAGQNKLGLARILRRLLDSISNSDGEERLVELAATEQVLDWALREQKGFLRPRLQLRLAGLLLSRGELRRAKTFLDPALSEAKAAEDKPLLVEAHLLESRLFAASKNWPRARASLAACRAAAGGIYIAPTLQAEIETAAGTLHLAERDLQVAYSYLYEGFEGFHQSGLRARASTGFRYLLLCRVLMGALDEAQALIAGRYGQIYAGEGGATPAMLAILEAYRSRDLAALTDTLERHRAVIEADKLIAAQMELLYEQLLEKNIEKLIAPYSRVELAYLATKLGVTAERVEKKVCEMILDEKMKGSIDQESGVLILYEKERENELFQNSLEILKNIDLAVSELFERANKLNA